MSRSTQHKRPLFIPQLYHSPFEYQFEPDPNAPKPKTNKELRDEFVDRHFETTPTAMKEMNDYAQTLR